MSKTIQMYEIELGLAQAELLQKNQERARRGKTPLQPTLDNKVAASETTTKAYADNSASNAQISANNYTNSQIASANAYADSKDAALIPSGSQIMWDLTGPVPSGWIDTGYTIAFVQGPTRRIIRKS